MKTTITFPRTQLLSPAILAAFAAVQCALVAAIRRAVLAALRIVLNLALRYACLILVMIALGVSTAPVPARAAAAPLGFGTSPAANAAVLIGQGAWMIDFALHLPLLAQAAPEPAIERFLSFLAKVFIVIGAILIAFGAYELSRGRITEALFSVVAGLLLALSIPLMRWLNTIV